MTDWSSRDVVTEARYACNTIAGELEEGERGSIEIAGVLVDEVNRLRNLIDAHNHDVQAACGFGELEADRCGYRPDFVKTGRRCTQCPIDWKIER